MIEYTPCPVTLNHTLTFYISFNGLKEFNHQSTDYPNPNHNPNNNNNKKEVVESQHVLSPVNIHQCCGLYKYVMQNLTNRCQ